MNTQVLEKKMVEEEAFYHFTSAYEHATGDSLEIAACHDRPDFDCQRKDGSLCGLEITQVRSDPNEILLRGPSMSPSEAVELISHAVYKKDQKRQEEDWRFADDTILVVQLINCPLNELDSILDDWLAEGLAECGFTEVWIADYTTLEAFREVELYCVLPRTLQGRYRRANMNRKPYG